MASRPISVRSSSGNYCVHCAPALLSRLHKLLAGLPAPSSIHVLSSPKVWSKLGPRLRKGLPARPAFHLHLFNDAESRKSLSTVEALSRSLVRAGADRRSLLIAFGGGVIGDVVGFVAASYLRGVQLVQIPTTLVSQVDSSVGGKTGVNLPEGKNLVGAFYPPNLVVVDPELLSTLPDREFRGGLAEVIKYGVIADARLFSFLESNMDAILRRDSAALQHIIRRSIEIKARVVSQDERESGLREILNFGHTFGHALESVTRYTRYQHGEAVAWGMMAAAVLGHEALRTPPDHVARLVSLTRRIGPFPAWPAGSPRALLDAMRSDKKARSGKLRFVLSPSLGRAASYGDISDKAVLSVLRLGPSLFHAPRIGAGKSHA